MYEVTDDFIWGVVKARFDRWSDKLIKELKERLRQMTTKNQFDQALKELTDAYDKKIAGLQSQINSLTSAPADLTGAATDVLAAAQKVDPAISLDTTTLPDTPVSQGVLPLGDAAATPTNPTVQGGQ